MTNGAAVRGIGDRSWALIAQLRASPRAMEFLNAAVLVVVCTVLVALGDINFWGDPRPRWVHMLPVLIAGAGTALRRRSIAASVLLSALAIGLEASLGGSIVLVVIVLDALYNAALCGGRRLRGTVIGICAVAALFIAGAVNGAGRSTDSFVLNLMQVAALLGTPLWWGSNVRQRNEIAALADERIELEKARASDIERFAVLDRQEAVRSERSRMASDLHDAIASRLSAIAIHSGAALAASPSSARDRAALELARTSSVAALEDMRVMITVLRSEQGGSSADASPSPPIEWLSDLTDAARAAGSPVRVHGALPQGLSPALGQAIYRIVQESLTNAAKHAPQSTVDVHFTFDGNAGHMLVRNEATGALAPESLGGALSAGTGLLIMRERAEAFGATLFAGARGSSWCVELDVPVTIDSSDRLLTGGEVHE